jgi:hypothetical protein
MARHPLRDATAFPLDPEIVESCLNGQRPVDAVFRRAFRRSLAAVPPPLRPAALAGVTGHVAESVTEVILHELGYFPLWHFAATGGHGIDLAMLAPTADRVIVLEVKGTLRAHRLPRLAHGELLQLSAAWTDKSDNPGMTELGLTSDDVYSGFAVVQFAEREYRFGLSRDFKTLQPVESIGQLADLSWLD